MGHSSEPMLFGPLTCPACGTTEVNDYVLQLNHFPASIPNSGGRCTLQRLVAQQLQGDLPDDLRADREQRAREIGL